MPATELIQLGKGPQQHRCHFTKVETSVSSSAEYSLKEKYDGEQQDIGTTT